MDPLVSLTEKLRKRNRVERSLASFPAKVPLIKLIGVANLQSPVKTRKFLP